MADVVFLALTAAFFAAAIGLVRACERLLGDEIYQTDRAVTAPTPESPEPEQVAA